MDGGGGLSEKETQKSPDLDKGAAEEFKRKKEGWE